MRSEAEQYEEEKRKEQRPAYFNARTDVPQISRGNEAYADYAYDVEADDDEETLRLKPERKRNMKPPL